MSASGRDAFGPGRGRAIALALAAAAPAVALTAGLLIFAGREAAGRTPLSDGPPLNIAEAAGLARPTEVLRRLGQGEDPGQVLPLRPEVISESVRRATAFEAAVWSRRRELLELMVDERPPDAGTRAHLTCLARDLNIAEIVEYLSPDAPPDCVADAAIRAVRERSIPR